MNIVLTSLYDEAVSTLCVCIYFIYLFTNTSFQRQKYVTTCNRPRCRHLIHNLLHAFSNEHRRWPNLQLHSLRGPVLTKGLCAARNLNTEVIQPRNALQTTNVAGGRKLVKQTTLFSNLLSRRGDRADHSFPTAVPVLPAG